MSSAPKTMPIFVEIDPIDFHKIGMVMGVGTDEIIIQSNFRGSRYGGSKFPFSR